MPTRKALCTLLSIDTPFRREAGISIYANYYITRLSFTIRDTYLPVTVMAQAEQTQQKPLSSQEPPRLLQYVPTHRIVICKVCQYAIQPRAISRHLKDYHQIRRHARRPFMRYVASLDLREPQDVVMPTIPVAPVPFLPITSGLACCIPACRYLSISIKSLTTHWNAEHSTSEQTGVRWHHVKLQTFFRGNRLKYFEVSQADSKQERGRNDIIEARVHHTEVSYYHCCVPRLAL
jgi:hypothetical protein